MLDSYYNGQEIECTVEDNDGECFDGIQWCHIHGWWEIYLGITYFPYEKETACITKWSQNDADLQFTMPS